MGGLYYISNEFLPKFRSICAESRQDLAFVNMVMNNSSRLICLLHE